MTQRVRGTVINIHSFGATVRLESGDVASVPISDVNENRSTYTRALASRTNLPFDSSEDPPRAVLRLAKTRIDEPIDPSTTAPALRNERFEEQLAGYLKETQEWELEDAPPAHERHFLRKKRRAAIFENRR
ncbi:MAG: hypothetical protein JOZ59_06100 [Candidatus Eremiobacteraeota bacterium]|nr:hypothetical protein [Candidatus Eremiobacteraeota bacterium]MBV9276766.1 hypothetical protein [Candidatus Eremiobacteraeota bacterium]